LIRRDGKRFLRELSDQDESNNNGLEKGDKEIRRRYGDGGRRV